MILKNFFDDIPSAFSEEQLEVLQTGEGIRIERIVSRGQVSPEGFWYDQNEAEWVLVLKGAATLMFEGKKDSVFLGPGDYLNIAAHTRHRVEWTDPDQETVWLAVHYKEG